MSQTIYDPVQYHDPYDIDEMTLVKLAKELVMNIRNYKDIFRDFGISEDDYVIIEKNPFFRKVREQFTLEWNAVGSTKDRTTLQAQAAWEQLMPVLVRRALREDTNIGASTDVGKLVMKAAGIGDKSEEKGNAERFVIHIDMSAGSDTPAVEHYNKSVVIDVTNGGIDAIGEGNGETVDEATQRPTDKRFRVTREGSGEIGERERQLSREQPKPRPQRVKPGRAAWHTIREKGSAGQGEG